MKPTIPAETDDELLAEIDELLAHEANRPNPAYLSQMEMALANRTRYPYKDGKADLEEFVAIWKDRASKVPLSRFFELSNKLKKYGIIPDDIANHAKLLADERANGPRVPDVLDFTEHKAMDVIDAKPDNQKE